MHVLVLTHALPWHRPGGLEQATWAAVRGLLARGHRVTIVTTPLRPGQARQFDLPDAYERPGSRHIDVHVGAETSGREFLSELSILFVRGRPAHPTPSFWRAAADLAHSGWLGFQRKGWPADRGAVDVVFAVDTAAMFLRRAPFVLQLHGTLFSETTLHPGFAAHRDEFSFLAGLWRYKGRVAAAPFFRPMLGRAARIVADSEFIAGLLTAGRPDLAPHVTTLPLALDPRWMEALRSADEAGRHERAPLSPAAFGAARPLRLLTVGRAARIKGHELVARALSALLRMGHERSHIIWEIAGPPPDVRRDLPSFEALRTAGDGGVAMRPLGVLAQADLAAAYARADLLLNLEYNQPAFGLVALEAMTAGCVPIVSARGALPEIVGAGSREARGADAPLPEPAPAGFVLPAGDAKSLAALLARVYCAGPGFLGEASSAARARARSFDFDGYIQRLEGILADAAAAAGRGVSGSGPQ